MRNWKRLAAAGLVFILSASLLAGCQKKDGEQKSSDGKTKLTLGVWDEKQRAGLESMIEAYRAKHKDVEIEIQMTPYKGGEYWTKLEAAATGGSAPDVFWVNALHVDAYNEGGILKDLTEASKELDLKTNFPVSLVEAYNRNDKQIAIPKDFDTNALWYNKEIFDKAGVAYPTDDWTYADLVETAKKLKDSGLAEGVYPFACPVDFQTWYYPTVYAAGGWILNKEKTETGYNDPKTQAGIQCWIDLIGEGLSPTAASLSETNADTMFGAGKLAMNLAGSYMTSEYLSNDALKNKINLVEFPSWEGVEPNIINGLGYAVYEGTKNEKAAVEFAVWLGSEEAMKIQGEAGAVISARKDASEYFVKANPDVNLAAYTNNVDSAKPLPICTSAAELYDLEANKLKLAYSGEMSLAEACKELKKEADELINK